MPKKTKKSKPVLVDAYKATGKNITEQDIKAAVEGQSTLDIFFLAQLCLDFGKLLTGMPLYFYQQAIAWRVFVAVLGFEGAELSVLLSRQSGKSETVAFIIDTLCVLMPSLANYFPELEQFKSGFKVGVFAPQSDQVQNTYSRAMTRLSTQNAVTIMSDPDINIELESEVYLTLSNGSFLRGQIASKLSKIESATYDLIFVEEAQDVEDYIVNKSIDPMRTATGGSLIKVGTTGTTKNHFWYSIVENRKLDRKITDERMRNHFEFDYKKVIKYRREQYEVDKKDYHLRYENIVKKISERRGSDSQDFKLSYALIWEIESGMLVTDAEFDKILNRKKKLEKWDDNDIMVAGWDIGKVINSSVFTIGKVIEPEEGLQDWETPRKQIVAWIELRGMDYEAQHHTILELLIKYNIKKLAGDYTGVGKAVLDRMMYACGEFVEVIPFTFSRQSKSEMWYKFTSDISSRRLIVPADREVKATPEFQRFEEQMKNAVKYHDGPYLVVHKGEGYMDDYVDSAALMCMAADEKGVQQYEVEEEDYNPFSNDISEARRRSQQNAY